MKTMTTTIEDPTTSSASGRIVLESFDEPTHKWEEMNDPVMGGKSTGTFTIKDGLGKFEGKVVNVPFLNAPGFLQARTVSNKKTDQSYFPDVSSCTGLEIVAKQGRSQQNPLQPIISSASSLKSPKDDDDDGSSYQGYRISFGNAHAPGGKYFAYGYKSNLKGIPIDEFGSVTIPFNEFTDFWDDATGDPIHTCMENKLYCPDELALKNMGRIAIWAEGVAGVVSLEIKTIAAIGCAE